MLSFGSWNICSSLTLLRDLIKWIKPVMQHRMLFWDSLQILRNNCTIGSTHCTQRSQLQFSFTDLLNVHVFRYSEADVSCIGLRQILSLGSDESPEEIALKKLFQEFVLRLSGAVILILNNYDCFVAIAVIPSSSFRVYFLSDVQGNVSSFLEWATEHYMFYKCSKS